MGGLLRLLPVVLPYSLVNTAHYCNPPCSSNGTCPSDVPSGVSATPTCVFPGVPKIWNVSLCGLWCTPSDTLPNGGNGECGSGSCQIMKNTLRGGICTYNISHFAPNTVVV